MKPHILGGICPNTLMPLSQYEVYRRAARRAKIRSEMERVANASESHLPPEERGEPGAPPRLRKSA